MPPKTALPTSAAIMSAMQPQMLRDWEHLDEHDVIRFAYELDESQGKPVQVVELVFRHRTTGRKSGLRFRGVKLNYLFPVTARDDAKLMVVNNALLKKKRDRQEPRMLEVQFSVVDGSNEVMFWAGSVEDF